jgi:mannan endo-1,4-beta-mannosidase
MTMPPSGPAAHRPLRSSRQGRRFNRSIGRGLLSAAMVVAIATVTAGVIHVVAPSNSVQRPSIDGPATIGTFSHHHVVITLPAHTASYQGAFARGVPESYAPIRALENVTGVHLNIALYYSSWYERFQSAFATGVKDNGAVPFIQIEPADVRFAAIVAGRYDTYLETFATAVASYGAKTGQGVIIGFGHEMNGYWYPWGYRHVAPALFVAAWRHIVNVFRQQGAYNVAWLWTVNIIAAPKGVPSPAAWWPGDSYVTWVGIDGYYYKSSWTFASLFGPTIKAIRALTLDPILIAETGVARTADQPEKIADLFAGIHSYGLLGFVWFNADGVRDWRLGGPAAFAAFRRGAKTFQRLAS